MNVCPISQLDKAPEVTKIISISSQFHLRYIKNTMVKLAQSPGKNTSCRTTFATTILSCIRFFQNTFAVVPQKCGKSCKEEKKFLSGQQWNVSAEKNFIIFQCRKEFSLSQIVDRFRLLKDYSALILKYLLVELNRIG